MQQRTSVGKCLHLLSRGSREEAMQKWAVERIPTQLFQASQWLSNWLSHLEAQWTYSGVSPGFAETGASESAFTARFLGDCGQTCLKMRLWQRDQFYYSMSWTLSFQGSPGGYSWVGDAGSSGIHSRTDKKWQEMILLFCKGISRAKAMSIELKFFESFFFKAGCKCENGPLRPGIKVQGRAGTDCNWPHWGTSWAYRLYLKSCSLCCLWLFFIESDD